MQALYVVAVTVLFPGSVLALAAGAVFGLVLGSLLVWMGTVLGQTLAFMIGRYSNRACNSHFRHCVLDSYEIRCDIKIQSCLGALCVICSVVVPSCVQSQMGHVFGMSLVLM